MANGTRRNQFFFTPQQLSSPQQQPAQLGGPIPRSAFFPSPISTDPILTGVPSLESQLRLRRQRQLRLGRGRRAGTLLTDPTGTSILGSGAPFEQVSLLGS
jgi:hypothetical protein